MISVGLTGNRFSGKDRVAKMFEQISIPVFHADIILKFLLQYDLTLDREINIQLGKSIYGSSGHLDPIKFDNKDKFNRLIDIVEPVLFNIWEKFQQKNAQSIYCIFHSSIIFERNWNKKFNKCISVFAPKTERVKRAQEKEPLLLISIIYDLLAKEFDDLDKNRLSEFIIHNYSEATDITRQVDNIDQQIIDMFLKDEQIKSSKNLQKIYPL
jgi:dephospho-CoA kinase